MKMQRSSSSSVKTECSIGYSVLGLARQPPAIAGVGETPVATKYNDVEILSKPSAGEPRVVFSVRDQPTAHVTPEYLDTYDQPK